MNAAPRHDSIKSLRIIPFMIVEFMNELLNVINILLYCHNMLIKRTSRWVAVRCSYTSALRDEMSSLKAIITGAKISNPEGGTSLEHRGIIILFREEVKSVFHMLYADIWMTRTWFPDFVFLITQLEKFILRTDYHIVIVKNYGTLYNIVHQNAVPNRS